MPAKPMLDALELQQVQKIEAEENESVIQHRVPVLEGDFLQDLGRRAVRITLNGVLTGAEAAEGLKSLREKFQKAAPVPFVADIATATTVDQVLVEEMNIRELAGKPERFEYALAIREFIPPPQPEQQQPPPQPLPKPHPVDTATLIVEVIVDGQPNFDFSTVTVTVAGTQADGTQFPPRTLSNRVNNLWTEDNMPPGQYNAQALVSAPQTMTGSADAQLQAGQTTRATIHLTPGAVIAQTFVVHFAIDKAFIEPCLRQVLRDAAQFATDNPTAKLLISGNTDLVGTPGAPTGSDPYNQSLSERRGRSVFAYLTFGRDPDGAASEWKELRQRQTVSNPTIHDNWGTRQYQYMLQDLEFYPGQIDGQDGPLTQEAIRAFRCHVGLPPGNTMDDPTWDALIRAYMGQDSLAVPASQFFSNCGTEILKWTGCASQDPVRNVRVAWRPNRRVDLLFVHATSLPCQIPQPDTFNLPAAGSVNSGWCLGPGDVHHRSCFVVPALPPGGQPSGNEWVRQPAQPGTITVQGTITHDDGTPFANGRFVLIAPTGENKSGEQPHGTPIPATTDASGNFQFSGMPVGVYSLEVKTSTAVLVRLQEDDDSAAKGSIVCKEMRSDTDRLNVLILSDPVLREIRLPLVAHLMAALHPLTRAVRTCPSPVGPPQPQATAHTDDEIRAAFATANQIWRQARIHFELTDIVREAYAFRTDCEIDDSEIQILLDRANYSYPNVVNVFFVGDLAGTAEAGGTISVEDGAAQSIAGCMISDRFQFTLLGIPQEAPLNSDQTAQTLAHELGHYLNLSHVDATPANSNRLMLPGTATGDNRTLVRDEVDRARASRGANDDCVPLSLTVTGATRIGGTLSNRFIVIQGSPTVTVDAQIPDRMLDPAMGTLTMTGGDPGANNKQRVVTTASNRTEDVVATYTPANGGQPVTRHDIILVSTFQLRVDGATQVGGAASTIFVTSGDPNQVVTIIAELDPAPFAIPSTLVTWNGGTAVADPLRHTVSRATASETTVSATVAGVTRSVTISVISVQIDSVPIIGRGQNADFPVTIQPSPLPAGIVLTLRLVTTSGTGEARFAANNAVITTVSQTGNVSVHGVTESSVAGNMRLTATLTGQTGPAASQDFTVVAVTIGDIVGIRVNETRNIPLTILPSPLAPTTSLTVELHTTSGTGSATLVGTGASTTITQTGVVSVRGIAPSSVVDNIRLSVRATGQTAVLAQEDFTVLNRLSFFLRFEVWNETSHAFEPLPAGINVDIIDKNPILSDTRISTQPTDSQGRVLFSLPDFSPSSEQTPDLFFLVHTNRRFSSGHILPDQWSTVGWIATDGTPGLQRNFAGTGMGTESTPIVFRIGLDFHIRLIYLDESKSPARDTIAPKGTSVALFGSDNNKRREVLVDEQGEAHAVVFNVEGGDSIFFRVNFIIEDAAINMHRAGVDIDPWDTSFGNNQSTSIGTQAAPFVLRATSNNRNRALFILKNLRELSTFLFHMTGGLWTGFDSLTINFSSILTSVNGQVPFSWPVGTVQMPDGTVSAPPPPHSYQWDRGTHIHEISHQIMWKELGFSTADIAFAGIFGNLVLTHREDMLANPEHALIEGWAEFMEAVFARQNIPPYSVTTVVNSTGRNPQPLGPPPNNRGESVEGAFANGLWRIFVNHVVTAAVSPDAMVQESANGDVTVNNPWLLDPGVRARFLAIIWNPFLDTRAASSKSTTAMIAAIQARNNPIWPALQAELQAFNMALP